MKTLAKQARAKWKVYRQSTAWAKCRVLQPHLPVPQFCPKTRKAVSQFSSHPKTASRMHPGTEARARTELVIHAAQEMKVWTCGSAHLQIRSLAIFQVLPPSSHSVSLLKALFPIPQNKWSIAQKSALVCILPWVFYPLICISKYSLPSTDFYTDTVEL